MPQRIQMTRNKPWRPDNPDAVIVARPTKYGNPFKIGDDGVPDAETAVECFEGMWGLIDVTELRGKDLACWCPLGQPCHADVLLEWANHPAQPKAEGE